jgi:dockerin type I repeat protein
LKFTPAPDANGAGLTGFSFKVQDDGGTANGGVNLAQSANSISFNVNAVNDAPSFTRGADEAATDEDGRSTVPIKSFPGWAKSISVGPANESTQTVLPFTVTNDNNGLFSTQPAIDATGNLTFKPAPNAHGTAVVSVSIKDSGGTANGGIDTSPIQQFNITISKPHPFHNVARGLDVNNDGSVVAGDALIIINGINAFGSGALPRGNFTGFGPSYVDTNTDNFLTAADALAVINWINSHGSGTPGPEGEGGGGGEGEASASDTYFYDISGFGQQAPASTAVAPATHDAMADVIALLAADTAAEQDKRRRV